MKPEYKRVLIKLSGEGLAGKGQTGLDAELIDKVATDISCVAELGVQVCVVVGGGNFFRGAKNATAAMDRSVADQIGMMATVMNALALRSALQRLGMKTTVYSGFPVPQACQTYQFEKAMQSLESGETVIFAGGTGNPYFTTDSGAALRAIEMHCDVLMKATQVDGVYDSDPRYNKEAKRYDEISYAEVLEKHLNVMDLTAVALAGDNHLPIMVFALNEENALLKAVCGKNKRTIIK